MDENNLNYDIFIKGNLVDLVIITEEIVEHTNWYNWFNDEETTLHMQQHYYPNTKSMQMDFYKKIIKNNKEKIQLGIYHKKDKILCGLVSLNKIDNLNRNAEISLIIGENKYRKLEVSHEAMKLIINHAFNTINLHKINAGYIETLESWGLFLRRTFGFSNEGIQKEQVYKNGKYLNIVNLGLTKNQYHTMIKENINEEKSD